MNTQSPNIEAEVAMFSCQYSTTTSLRQSLCPFPPWTISQLWGKTRGITVRLSLQKDLSYSGRRKIQFPSPWGTTISLPNRYISNKNNSKPESLKLFELLNLKNLKPFKERSGHFKNYYNMLNQRSVLLHYSIPCSSQYWVLGACT